MNAIELSQYGPVGRPAWIDTDWREHQRWTRIDGRAVNYIELGDPSAPPVVFVHGLSGCWQNWLENLLEFSREHRVLAVDLPGFGASEMPPAKITISGYARWLDRFCAEVGVEAAAFVGNSMGGFVSAELAITFPHRVERLVLVSAAGLSVEHQRNELILRGMEVTENIAQAAFAYSTARSRRLALRPRGRIAMLWVVARHADRLSPAITIEQVAGSGKPGFVQALDALTSYPIRERLADIEAPTLIVWGTHDRLVPLKDAYVFDELIADSRLLVYNDTGHVPMIERPDRFNADVLAFVAEQADDANERREDAVKQAS